MKIQSLIRDSDLLVPVEVELNFLPGLPQIQFLGLPDQAIKESIHRIKSAIRSQGFDFPKAQQVLVNLRPAHLKKNSRGLELAVALGILWESGQLAKPDTYSILVYGELSLTGEVFEPEDLAQDYDGLKEIVWTGVTKVSQLPFPRMQLMDLRGFESASYLEAASRHHQLSRPQFALNLEFPERQAEILKLAALGEHSLLLAGPSGSGKSTMAKALISLLEEPSQEDMHEIIKNNRSVGGETLSWRPLIHPHHSTPPLGLIGGGIPPYKGEIVRAHKGVLLLDELLEFHPRAQEALREPMEELKISLRRGRFFEEYPAEALVVSTTNLCPCGDWVPQKKVICGRSLKRCRSYAERLSGPLVDRFQILFFTQKQESGAVIKGDEILTSLQRAREFRRQMAEQDSRFKKVTTRWSREELTQDLSDFYLRELFPKEITSRRRDLATLKIARSYADLEQEKRLDSRHIEKALKITYRPFEALKRLSD